MHLVQEECTPHTATNAKLRQMIVTKYIKKNETTYNWVGLTERLGEHTIPSLKLTAARFSSGSNGNLSESINQIPVSKLNVAKTLEREHSVSEVSQQTLSELSLLDQRVYDRVKLDFEPGKLLLLEVVV